MKIKELGKWEGTPKQMLEGDTIHLMWNNKVILCEEVTQNFTLKKGIVFEFENAFGMKKGVGGAIGE